MKNSRAILKANGIFLILAGVSQTANALVGYFTGKGLFSLLETTPVAPVGIVESHMAAGLFGIALIWASRHAPVRFWHVLAALLHTILASANILFWRSTFVALDAEIPGIVATVIHLAFVLAQTIAAVRNKPEPIVS